MPTTDNVRDASLWYLSNLVEDQVRFGDTKASLLIAGDALLLTICGAMIKTGLDCRLNGQLRCPSAAGEVVVPAIAAAFLLASVAIALLAVMPNVVHKDPPKELFLFSWIGKEEKAQPFLDAWENATDGDMNRDLLRGIYGKSRYGRRKFRNLRWAIQATLASVGFIAIALALQIFA
jgi:hypothetical protein